MVLLNEIGNNNMNPPLSFTPSPYKSFGVRKKNYVKTKRSIQSWFNQSNHGTSD